MGNLVQPGGIELVDVLNADGTPTGVAKPKSEVHRAGHWHRCAHLWIVGSDGRLLLQKRSDSKENWPGRWDVSVAGHLSAGETAIEGAIREAQEELGLKVNASQLVHVATTREQQVLHGGRYLDNEVQEVFVARIDVDPSALVLDAGEVAEVRIVRWNEIERLDPVPHAEEYAALGRFLETSKR